MCFLKDFSVSATAVPFLSANHQVKVKVNPSPQPFSGLDLTAIDNHSRVNAINTELTLPKLPAKRTYRSDERIDAIDPTRRLGAAQRRLPS
jgi:hypothetical protein